MKYSFSIVALATILLSLSAFAQAPSLFVHDAKSALGTQFEGDDPAITRRAPVLFNSAAVPTLNTTPGTIIDANVFGDVSLSVVLETLRITSESTYSWSGYVLGEPDTSSAIFTIHQNVMVANIHSPSQGFYQLRTTENGAPSIREIDLTLAGTCGTDGLVENPITPSVLKNLNIPKGGATDLLDLLAVYTPAARTGAGGHDSIQAVIQLAVDEFNTVLDNSLVDMDVRLVHMEEIAYTETGAATFDNALSDVRGTSDGEMDSVHTLRNTYGADFVTLFLDDVEGTSTLGLAYVASVGTLFGSGESAFSTVQYDASSLYVLAHEVGHNLGNVHENNTGIYAYSNGYFGGSFCTVMCASVGPGSVAHFSNPTTGHGVTNVADVARSIDEVAGTMTAFRSQADKLAITPLADYDSTRISVSSASPSSKTYTLTNLSNTSSINWTTSVSETWVTLNSSGSTLAANATFDLIVTIDSSAFSLPIGDHTATITITDTTNSDVSTPTVNFTVPVAGFSFDSDPSWVTGTGWAFGTPTGGTASNGNPDPTSGFTGSNVYGVNLSGAAPFVFDSSPSYLVSSAIDLTNATDTTLSFRRWLNSFGTTNEAIATVDVSNDNSNWFNVYTVPTSGNFDATWNQVTYDISGTADNQSTVYIRWGYYTTTSGSMFPATGWNIDDVVVSGTVDADAEVTTAAASSIAATSAVGNGNITDLGIPNPTAHGVVWGTSVDPTLANSFTDEGATSSTGTFTSKMTGLTPGQTYFYRAYATNLSGTFYGANQTFTTLGLLSEVWVDLAFGGTPDGTQSNPFSLVDPAIDTLTSGGTLKLKGDTGDTESDEVLTLSKPMTIEAVNGAVRIGVANP